MPNVVSKTLTFLRVWGRNMRVNIEIAAWGSITHFILLKAEQISFLARARTADHMGMSFYHLLRWHPAVRPHFIGVAYNKSTPEKPLACMCRLGSQPALTKYNRAHLKWHHFWLNVRCCMFSLFSLCKTFLHLGEKRFLQERAVLELLFPMH